MHASVAVDGFGKQDGDTFQAPILLYGGEKPGTAFPLLFTRSPSSALSRSTEQPRPAHWQLRRWTPTAFLSVPPEPSRGLEASSQNE